ncbi:MAG: cytochrome b [Pseudomonadota bacterium]
MQDVQERYTSVAIALHWLIAASIILQLASGLWMADAINEPATQALAFEVYQWHKSLGLTVLILSLLRLLWRLTHRVPGLPDGMKPWEIMAAKATHVLFYVIMIVMPLTGWVIVSASAFGLPTLYWGLFTWPHLPITGLASETKAVIENIFGEVHALLGYGTIGLLALHVGAALKHHFIARDAVLARMLPFLKRAA